MLLTDLDFGGQVRPNKIICNVILGQEMKKKSTSLSLPIPEGRDKRVNTNLNECMWPGGIVAGADCTLCSLERFLVCCEISNLGSSGWHGGLLVFLCASDTGLSLYKFNTCRALKSDNTLVF